MKSAFDSLKKEPVIVQIVVLAMGVLAVAVAASSIYANVIAPFLP